MSRRPLGFNPMTGVESWWHEDSEGNWAVENVQRASDILDLNKEAQNHCNPYNAARDLRLQARIPLIVIAKWRNELGIDYWDPDPDVQRKIDRLLDDPEWRWLRVDYGHSSGVLLSPPKEPLVVL